MGESTAWTAPITRDAFKWLRKVLALKATELAPLLDVAQETISRWDTGERAPDRAAWALLSTMVLEHLEGRSTTIERLRALRDERPPSVVLTLKPA